MPVVPLWEDAGNGVRVFRVTASPAPGERDAGEATAAAASAPLVRLFEAVARREGWRPGDALRRLRPRSVYFALEVEGRLAGGLQLVLPDASGRLPCHDLWPELPRGEGAAAAAAHVAVLALEEEFRGQELLFWRLAAELWRFCVETGVSVLLLEVTPRVLPLYRRLGWPLEVVGERRPHWGEDCYLCSLGVPDVTETLLRRAERSPSCRRVLLQAFRMTSPAGHAAAGADRAAA